MPTAKQYADECRAVYAQIARLRKASRAVRAYEGDKSADALWAESNRLLAEQTKLVEVTVSRLPFKWATAHAYTPNEAHSYGGDDHILVLEDFAMYRFSRKNGQTLGEPPSKKFWGLQEVEASRLPTCCACFGQAMALISK